MTWKKQDDGTQKAKARLVLLGYQDPDLGEYQRSSPTLTRTARHLILAVAAQERWRLFSLDAKNAFLAGDLSSRVKELYMRVPPDLLEMLDLSPDSVFKLRKSAYGLAEAPIAWFRHLKKVMLSLGWKAHPLDECFLMMHDKAKNLIGICGVHVDDLLIAGHGKIFEDNMKRLEQSLPFGTRKYDKFTYTGLRIQQSKIGDVTVDQEEYIEQLQPMAAKHLKQDKVIPESERTNYRSLIGGLSWSVINRDWSQRSGCKFWEQDPEKTQIRTCSASIHSNC